MEQINNAADAVSKAAADATTTATNAAEDVKNAVMGGAPPSTQVGETAETAKAQVRCVPARSRSAAMIATLAHPGVVAPSEA